MEETITVGEIIDQLQKFDRNKPCYIYGVGITHKMDWKAPLFFGDETVDERDDEVHINFSTL